MSKTITSGQPFQQFSLIPPEPEDKYARQKRWAARNRDKVYARTSKWAKENPAKRYAIKKRSEAKHKDRVQAYSRERHKRTWPLIRDRENAKRRENYFLKKYGVPITELDKLAEAQHGLCAICEKPFGDRKRRHIDHCHQTGKIRGILCSKCNQALGLFKDDLRSLQRATMYLIRNLSIQ